MLAHCNCCLVPFAQSKHVHHTKQALAAPKYPHIKRRHRIIAVITTIIKGERGQLNPENDINHTTKSTRDEFIYVD